MDLTANQQQAFSFPILKNADILHCMSELGIDLTVDELNEPHRHKDRVRAVFVNLLAIGRGMTEEDLCSHSDEALRRRDALSHPEMHEDSLSELKFLKSAMKFMMVCGLRDFGWKDLHAPTSKRFRRQLSGAINFARFREERMLMYDELTTQREEIVVQLQEVKDEGTKLNIQLEEAKLATDKELKEMEEIENDCVEMETEITQQNKLQATLRQESTDLKKQANNLKDKLATVSLTLQEAEAEERKLSLQVVQSPQRIKRELEIVTKSLEGERGECSSVENGIYLTQRKIDNVTQGFDDVSRALVAMEEVAEEKLRYESTLGEKNTAKEALAINENELSELQAKQDEYEGVIQRTEEKIDRMRQEGRQKIDAANKALEATHEELELVEKDRLEGMARVESHEEEVREIEKKIKEEKKKANAEIAEMIGQYRHLKAVVLEKDQELMKAIGAY
uniref:Uncharacterized protein n=2 Tax=Odontella aurita TaxID=265563 RepID=A0A7S4MY20_9STRA|mmetsp:Transcript_39549/g.118693  ORF Transcript_39549/g.118693 Transcript_39549/m.118693 type:complete len:451 (+) Transcript_39549:242-1594(+)